MIETSAEIKNIASALLKFQGLVEGVHKGANNPHFRTKYANLETVIDTARPALQQVGVMFTQSAGEIVDGSLAMTTMLIHAESGEWMKSTMQIPLGKKDPQGAGSAQTYAQRYSLMAILGVPPTDDDGEAAIDRQDTRPTPAKADPLEGAKRSSSSLKKEDAFGKLLRDYEADLPDAKSVVQYNELAKFYVGRAVEEGWPHNWIEELRSRFLGDRADIVKATKFVEDVESTVGKAVITNINGRELSPNEAG